MTLVAIGLGDCPETMERKQMKAMTGADVHGASGDSEPDVGPMCGVRL